MKITINRNENHDILQQFIKRIYDPADSFSWKDYKELEIEFIPLDLSAFPQLKTETATWIDKLFSEETTNRNGDYMLRGFTRMEAKEMELLDLHYGDYSDCLNFWAYNDFEYLLYTFCEGDTTLTIYPDKETYSEGKAETLRWYREEK